MSRARERAVIARTPEDKLFSAFLKRQATPAHRSKFDAPRFSNREIPCLLEAIQRLRPAVAHFGKYFAAELTALDRLKMELPNCIRLSVMWSRSGTAGRGHPIQNARQYFLLAALLPYAKQTKGRKAWSWISQELSFLEAEHDRPAEFWNRHIARRMGSDDRRDLNFDQLMAAGACAHLMHTKCRTLRMSPGTPVTADAANRMWKVKIPSSEEKILRQAGQLMPALMKYHSGFDDYLDPYWACQISWVA